MHSSYSHRCSVGHTPLLAAAVLAVAASVAAADPQWWDTNCGSTHIVTSIWGSGPDDVFAGTGLYDPVTETSYGSILHYDGSAWTTMDSGATSTVMSIWGSGPDDVFALVANGVLLHYDGSGWSVMKAGLPAAWALWGSGPNDVYIAGSPPWHYDGSTWAKVAGAPVVVAPAIWGSGPHDIYLAGLTRDGASLLDMIWHYDGASWSLAATIGTRIRKIWGSGPNDVYAVGYDPGSANGVIWHYDGTAWQDLSTTDTPYLADIWGSGPDDVYVLPAGKAPVLHYDGSTWSDIPIQWPPTLNAIWGSGPNDVFVTAVGTIWHYPGRWLSDIDRDGHTNESDLQIFASSFGLTSDQPGYDSACDLNNDQGVDVIDLLILVEQFGK